MRVVNVWAREGVLTGETNGAMSVLSAGAEAFSVRRPANVVGAGKPNSGFCDTGTSVSITVESSSVSYS